MEASAIEALVTASRQSAEMAQEAVKALKKMKEKGEKQEAEGFATASKVVKAPGLQGTKGMFNLYIYICGLFGPTQKDICSSAAACWGRNKSVPLFSPTARSDLT